MKLATSDRYEQIDKKQLAAGTVLAHISREIDDPQWDTFLQDNPQGQFQQCTMWAHAKNAEGWKTSRVVLTVDEDIAGGFQILSRSSWRGRMGYVSKGPVVSTRYAGLDEYAIQLLQQLARTEKLRAIVIQQPDLHSQSSPNPAIAGFDLDVLAGVNEATWIVDLKDGFEAVEQGMSKWTRKKVRQAANRGVRIRQGGREDIKTFFELMLVTCQRQGVAPVPADERTLLALWDAADSTQSIRLTFAEHGGKPLAALICILFGQTVSFWKKGWTSSDGQLHPNESLMHEMLQWACSKGYRFADFCAFDKRMAVAMLKEESLSPAQESSRHMFNVRLGGSPRLLPKARVYFPSPVFRLAYRALFHKKIRLANEN